MFSSASGLYHPGPTAETPFFPSELLPLSHHPPLHDLNHGCSQDPGSLLSLSLLPRFSPVLVHSIHKPSSTFNHTHMSAARSLLHATSYAPSGPLTSLFKQSKSIQNLHGKISPQVPLSFVPQSDPFQCFLTQQMITIHAKILDSSLSFVPYAIMTKLHWL